MAGGEDDKNKNKGKDPPQSFSVKPDARFATNRGAGPDIQHRSLIPDRRPPPPNRKEGK